MDASGPGAITRFWLPLNADKDKQVIRFYFDGESQPTISVKFNDLMSGRDFVPPPYAFVAWDETDLTHQIKAAPKMLRGVAGDMYLPIPFAHSCKITLDQVPFYYIINYREYTPLTRVKTFSMADYHDAKSNLARTASELLAATDPMQKTQEASGEIRAGGSRGVILPRGSNAIRDVLITLDPVTAPNIMRSTILEATFDGEQTIWCPLSELFGCGPRFKPVNDWDRTVTADGRLQLRFTMPYRSSGEINVHNLGSKPVYASLSIKTSHWHWGDSSMHFHAAWHSESDMNTRPLHDWNYLEFTGVGTYIGDTLSVYSPVGDWYGEGDERIYLNGDTFPAHIGTGTEDYYGYAWGMADYFSSPFLSVPARDIADRGNWRGYTTTSRMRLLDTIPVTNGLKVDMEIWNWADTKVDYAVATFWYAPPGVTHNRPPQPAEALLAIRQVPVTPGHVQIAGAIECETARILETSPGLVTEVQGAGLQEGGWSSGKQLFIHATGTADFITLEIPTSDNSPTHVTLYATQSYDYGILRFKLNGSVAGSDFDGYSAISKASGPIDLGMITPEKNSIRLRIEVSGANAAAKGKRYYCGLDCVTLSK